MIATKKEIEVTKTARYYQLGELNQSTKEVWLVCHGYGMLAEYFIRKFDVLLNDETVIIAPEAMSRFYNSGTSGRVGASWMTKDDRLVDIQDNLNYMNQLMDMVQSKVNKDQVRFRLLGFSQGSPTAARWMHQSNWKPDVYISWASDIPVDVLQPENKATWRETEVIIACGDEDQFISPQRLETHLQTLKDYGLSFEMISFQGDHRIYPAVLLELKETWV